MERFASGALWASLYELRPNMSFDERCALGLIYLTLKA
jgi:hypothetical protein